jgi:hypothetical protein
MAVTGAVVEEVARLDTLVRAVTAVVPQVAPRAQVAAAEVALVLPGQAAMDLAAEVLAYLDWVAMVMEAWAIQLEI